MSWTDENGRFDLPGLPAGKYRVEVEQLGFERAAVEATLASGATLPADQPEKEVAPGLEVTLHVLSVAELNAPAANAAAPTSTAAPNALPEGEKKETASGNPPTGGKSAPGKPAAPGPAGRAGQSANGQQANLADMIRRRIQQGGFQQVDLSGQQNGAQEGGGGQVETGPLGEASSSDAFLISGTVGRGGGSNDADAFMMGLGAMAGIMGGEGGVPGQPGAFGQPGQSGFGGPGGGRFDISIIGGAGGRGQQGGQGRQGQGQRGGQGQAQGQRGQQGGQNRGNQTQGNFGQGQEALWGLQRILRQQVNRIRFGFYIRYGNSEFDARPDSLTEANPSKIATYRDRFGVNVGGPLVIPHVYNGREKTFFFVNYDGSHTRDPVDTFATVPALEERKGDFTDRGVQLFDPLSSSTGPRTSFGSKIPQGRIDPAAVGLLQFIPLPNVPAAGLVQNFHLQTRVPTASDRLNVRVLHTISPKLNLQVTYNLAETRTHGFQTFPQLESNSHSRGQNVMVGLTQNWTQHFIHDTRLFFSRNKVSTLNQFAFVDNVAGDLGISGISTDPINFGVPQVAFTNFGDLNDPVPALRRNQTWRFLDNISYVHLKHTWRAGFEMRKIESNVKTDPTPRGSFSFTGLMTSDLVTTKDPNTGQLVTKPAQGTGFDFADFLLGLPQVTSQRFGSSSNSFRSWAFAGYFLDDFRIHPRFTLSWGLRYEGVTPPVERNDHLANLDVSPDFTTVAVVTPGQLAPFSGVLPRSLVRGDFNNWSPRLGIAWRPPLKWLGNKHQMTIRAGYGMFYNTSIYNQIDAAMANQPPFAQAQTRTTSATQVLTLENGFPPAPPTTVKNTVAVDPNYRLGYAQIWNASVETPLTTNLILDLTYTGTKGTKLDELRAPNRAPPGSVLATQIQSQVVNAFGFTYDTSGASSIYHALQVRVQRRMNKGLMIQGLYTFSKSIDNASSIGGGQVVVQDDTRPDLERGLSSFDIRHQFRGSYVYELPFGERKKWAQKGWPSTLFGHWQMNGAFTILSGTPFTARVLGNQADNTGTGSSFSQRADQVSNASLPAGQQNTQQFFDTVAFALPPVGFFGNAARNTIPGPGTFNVNFALARFMRFGKDQQRRIDLRWEVSNLTNTPNFSGLSTVVNSATYGRVTSVRAMRTIDMNLRVNF